MASPSLEIGSRVAYVLAVKGEERRKVREDTSNRCDGMERKDAIVVIHENIKVEERYWREI